MKYELIKKGKLNAGEVMRSYVFGWILFPLLIFWPFVIVFGWTFVSGERALPDVILIPAMVFSIVWLAVSVWKLKDWDENRWMK